MKMDQQPQTKIQKLQFFHLLMQGVAEAAEMGLSKFQIGFNKLKGLKKAGFNLDEIIILKEELGKANEKK